MIVTCPNCTAQLQLKASEIPARPFTVRCPKCQFIITAQPPANGGGALAVAGDLPVSSRPQRPKTPAPAYESDEVAETPAEAAPEPSLEGNDVVQMLAALLRRGMPEASKGLTEREGGRWERRRALVCAAPMYREDLARTLAHVGHQVFVAGDAAQAIERMRESRMDILILDPKFDPVDQGATRIKHEINSLRPAQRRRIFFVQLQDSARTADPYAAFLNNLNLVFNPTEMESLPKVLEQVMREHNELYHNYNHALGGDL